MASGCSSPRRNLGRVSNRGNAAVHMQSFDAQLLRSLLQSRLQLANMRRNASNQVRGALKVFGIVLPSGHVSTFDVSVIPWPH